MISLRLKKRGRPEGPPSATRGELTLGPDGSEWVAPADLPGLPEGKMIIMAGLIVFGLMFLALYCVGYILIKNIGKIW